MSPAHPRISGMTGGGAATNAGIDFQQRLGALAMVAMLVDDVDLGTVGLGDGGQKPSELRFETNDEIDDLVIVTPHGRIFVQAKNAVSLSSDEASDLAMVMRQFVRQFADDSDA